MIPTPSNYQIRDKANYLSLITAGSVKKIAKGFKGSKHKAIPHNLWLRDVVIQEDRVLKVIER